MKKVKVLGHILINVILFILFIHFFGIEFVQKYLDKAVIIKVQEEKHPNISLPGKLLVRILMTRRWSLENCIFYISDLLSLQYPPVQSRHLHWMEE